MLGCRPGARSSVGERLLHTQEVAGSKPAAPTLRRRRIAAFTIVAALAVQLVALQADAAPQKGRGLYATPGWQGSTLWDHRQDDWEPAIAAGPASDDVYQLGTRF